jgi:glycosyltransferase involved in cell wall biosynthesis
MSVTVSVICPVYNEGAYIEHFINALLEQDYPIEDIEYFIIDGMSNDSTKEVVKKICDRNIAFRLLENKFKFVPYALNLGIKEASGSVIIRMDAHASYPSNYISVLVYWLHTLNADNVGCQIETEVLHNTPKTTAIKVLLSSGFGVGNSLFRIGVKEITEVDTVPFGCYKRAVFDKVGLFNEKLIRNQDIEFNKRLKMAGGRIFLIPFIKCKYYARESFVELARNNYKNGLWNILTIRYSCNFKSISLRHFVPLIFILSLLLPIVVTPINHTFIFIPLVVFLSYLLFLLYHVIKNFRNCNPFLLAWSFIVLHFSYASGSLAGILKVFYLYFKNEKQILF